jgi:hypothetical protein
MFDLVCLENRRKDKKVQEVVPTSSRTIRETVFMTKGPGF